ncbi:MAG: hypothetical protein AAFQ11_10490 [Pseudomonadota bacterium]
MIDLTLDAAIEQMIFDAHLQPSDSAISETVEPKDGQLSDSVRAIRELATRFRGSARAALLVVGVQAALEGDALVLTRGEDRVLIVAASEAMLQVGTQTIELHSPAGGSASVYKAVVSLVLDWATERMKYDGR